MRAMRLARLSGLAIALVCAAPVAMQAQWINAGSYIYYNGGMVGIGTSSPSYLLDVLGTGASNGGNFHLKNLVAYQIGPRLILDNSAGFGQGSMDFYTIGGANPLTNNPSARWRAVDDSNYSAHMYFETKDTGSGGGNMNVRLSILSSGNVGIGTASPQHLLHVAGTIGAEEVIVSPTGADYVFDSGYRLAPLSEVKQYIQSNHHLPDVPSAADMHGNGIGVGEMQTKLLAKIEELTLHLIQAEERIQQLEKSAAASPAAK